MKIFAFEDPSFHPVLILEPVFKDVLIVGTWHEEKCILPGVFHSHLVSPLCVEFGADGTRIGEIIFSGGSSMFICSTAVSEKLDRLGSHFRFEPVQIDYRSLRPKQWEEVRKKNFLWPIPKKIISIDHKLNQLQEEVECVNCGIRKFKYKHGDIMVNADLDEVDVFGISENGKQAPVYVTPAYVALFEKFGIENVTFREAGRTVGISGHNSA